MMGTTLNILGETAFWAGGIWDWIISAGLLATTTLFVICIFGQKSKVELSPQREAAIATGHTDRKTLFENILFRPFLWVLLSICHSLNLPRGKDWLRQKLVAAGSPNYYTPEEYLALSLLMGCGFSLILEIFYVIVNGSLSLTSILLGLVIGLSLSIYQIAEKAQKRLREIMKELPYALDLISLAMGAGATFPEAVKTIIRDQRFGEEEHPLNVEFRAMLSEIELGTTRRQALQNMAARTPLGAMQNLVSSVMQAEELGTPLAKVLHDQSGLLRMQRSTRAEESAAKAGVRILVPCLLLVMAAILILFGPMMIRAMQGGLF